jgi:hypothetical protein
MRPTGGSRLGRSVLLATLLLAFAAPAAAATTWNVTNTGDGPSVCPSASSCTLRGAVADAGNGDVVSVPAGVYSMTASDPITISNSITISGAGSSTTTVDGGNDTRIFEIGPGGNTPTVTISGLNLQHGNGAGGDAPGEGGAVYVDSAGSVLTLQNDTIGNNVVTSVGGGVASNGTLTIDASTVTGNEATGLSGTGGGIYSNGALTIESGSSVTDNAAGGAGGGIFTNGLLLLTASTVSSNTADTIGGAIFSNAPITIGASTLSANAAGVGSVTSADGGAIFANGTLSISASTLDHNTAGASGSSGYGGAIANNSTLTLANSTLSANTANGALPFGQGGAIAASANATLTNDTLAGNSGQAQGGNIANDSSGATVTLANTIVSGGTAPTNSNCFTKGTLTSSGHNLEDTSPSQCGLGASGDLVGVNPQLGPLQDNGGPADTQALLTGSPAIDHGLNSACPSTDERGVSRPQGAACDIGAYEVAPPHATTGLANGVSSTDATLTGQAANPGAQAATVYFKYGTTTAYGSQVPAQSLGALVAATGVSAALSGLKPKTTYHYELVVVNPDGTSAGADQTFTTGALSLSAITVKPRRFKTAKGSGPSIVSNGTRGAIVSYGDSAAAKTTFTVLKPVRGYRSGGRCVAHKPKHAKHPKRCTRWVAVGSFTHQDTAGANRFRFSGRIGHRALKRGSYRLQAIARLLGNSSQKRTTAFVITG